LLNCDAAASAGTWRHRPLAAHMAAGGSATAPPWPSHSNAALAALAPEFTHRRRQGMSQHRAPFIRRYFCLISRQEAYNEVASTKNRWGARLALFALAVHFVLSFGHVHSDVLSHQLGTAIAAAMESDADPARGSGQPAHPYRGSTAHDFCALCASLNLLGSLILPDASPPVMLPDFDRVQFRHGLASIPSRPFRSFSEARAPPSA
jgi:hypothetical protein